MPRIRGTTSCPPRRGGGYALAAGAGPARRSPASAPATSSARATTRCWPSSSRSAPIARRRLTRLAQTLDETRVLGVTTNRGFLAWLLRLPEVVDGKSRTDTIETRWHPDAELPESAWAAAASALGARTAHQASAPSRSAAAFDSTGRVGWRSRSTANAGSCLSMPSTGGASRRRTSSSGPDRLSPGAETASSSTSMAAPSVPGLRRHRPSRAPCAPPTVARRCCGHHRADARGRVRRAGARGRGRRGASDLARARGHEDGERHHRAGRRVGGTGPGEGGPGRQPRRRPGRACRLKIEQPIVSESEVFTSSWAVVACGNGRLGVAPVTAASSDARRPVRRREGASHEHRSVHVRLEAGTSDRCGWWCRRARCKQPRTALPGRSGGCHHA